MADIYTEIPPLKNAEILFILGKESGRIISQIQNCHHTDAS